MDIKGIGKGALIAALGTAGGTLILTALSWAFGFHHAIWVRIVSVAIYPVPAWVLVPIGIFLGVVIVLWRAAESQISDGNARADTPTESAASVLSETAPLTENETTIVRLLARADGDLMSASELARRASLAKLVTDQTLDQLRAAARARAASLRRLLVGRGCGYMASVLRAAITRSPRDMCRRHLLRPNVARSGNAAVLLRVGGEVSRTVYDPFSGSGSPPVPPTGTISAPPAVKRRAATRKVA